MVQREDMERWGGDSERSTDNTKLHLSDGVCVLAERQLLPPGPDGCALARRGPLLSARRLRRRLGRGGANSQAVLTSTPPAGGAIDRVHRRDAESCVVCPQGAAANEKAGTGCSLQFYRAPRSLFLLLLTLAEATFSLQLYP